MLRQDKKKPSLKAEEYETETDNNLMMQLIVHRNNIIQLLYCGCGTEKVIINN
jgi:hypothetical protein